MRKQEFQAFSTNHSLRHTAATLLHNDDSNLSEQVIAERTGHRSPAIRRYKHTKSNLKRKVSSILTDSKSSQDGQSVICTPSVQLSQPPKLAPMKNSTLKAMRDGITCSQSESHEIDDSNVKRVKLDITVNIKQ